MSDEKEYLQLIDDTIAAGKYKADWSSLSLSLPVNIRLTGLPCRVINCLHGITKASSESSFTGAFTACPLMLANGIPAGCTILVRANMNTM